MTAQDLLIQAATSAGLSTEEHNHLLALTNYDDTEVLSDLNRLKDYNEGNWKILGNQMIYYNRLGVEFMRFDLLDSAGQPTSRSAMQRVKV